MYNKERKSLMSELKQANFRINQETADAFRTFCKEHGMDQAQGFDHIMQIVELDKAKSANPSRLTEIEEFERLAKSLIAAYLNSLEIANTTEDRVQEQFQTNLKNKDELIIKLQKDLKITSECLTKTEKEKKEAEEIAKKAETKLLEAKEREAAASKSIKDKESMNAMLQSRLTEAESKIANYDELKQLASTLQFELNTAKQEIQDNKKEAELTQFKEISKIKEETQRKIANIEKSIAEEKFEMEKQVMIAKSEKDTVIAKIKLEQATTLAKQAEKYQNKIDSLQETIHDLQEQINKITLNQTTKDEIQQ